MSGYDIAALVILILIAVILIAGFCVMAILPGLVASSRNHPNKDAVRIGGWVTLLFGGLFWPLMLVWAFVSGETKSSHSRETKMPPKEEEE